MVLILTNACIKVLAIGNPAHTCKLYYLYDNPLKKAKYLGVQAYKKLILINI